MILYVANRGEIARRVIRSAKRLGFRTVVGYANQDSELPFVKEADEAICLDGEEARDTYLNSKKVIEAAKKAKATFIHPGYGFLSENADFVDEVKNAGIEFVGPPSSAMRTLGDKIGSRKFLKTLNVPLLPSYQGDDQSESTLQFEANKLGYPILIKPSAGGGGKGMEKVFKKEDFPAALASSKRIAKSAFNDDRVFLEKLVEPARHIEVQILGDKDGNILTFGERECSLQRRHQKVFEETPCQFLSQKTRDTILNSSKALAQKANYSSAGTVEWIWDGKEGIYFLEVNARLQVEHPVTEMVWGVDLVEWQLRVARGESVKDLKFSPKGHAIEARLCAEDPPNEFLPSGGKIHRLKFPDDVRVDSGFEEKNVVPPQFDSLMAKVIAFGADRNEAISKLKSSLSSTVCFGPKTNRGYLLQILNDIRVIDGELTTNLLAEIKPEFDFAAGVELLKILNGSENLAGDDNDLDWYSPWGEIARENSELYFEDFQGTRFIHTPFADWSAPAPKRAQSSGAAAATEKNEENLKSPMPAKVIKVLASVGEQVKKGQVLVVLEAMKMEHQLKAPRDVKISRVHIKENERVGVDAILVEWS